MFFDKKRAQLSDAACAARRIPHHEESSIGTAVVMDGKAVQSCDIPLQAAAGKRITITEGLGSGEKLHPLQSAIIAEQAVQCGYCASGIIMSAYALFERNPTPSDDEIIAALDCNLCRCGAHARILRAIKRVAAQTRA